MSVNMGTPLRKTLLVLLAGLLIAGAAVVVRRRAPRPK